MFHVETTVARLPRTIRFEILNNCEKKNTNTSGKCLLKLADYRRPALTPAYARYLTSFCANINCVYWLEKFSNKAVVAEIVRKNKASYESITEVAKSRLDV